MKRVLGFVLSVLVVAAVRSESLPELYAPQGTLLLEHLASAPFPHQLRAHGHEYDGKLYDAAGHYSDDTVAIFIPKGFSQTGRVEFVIHFHGWKNHVEAVLRHYQLIEQLVASRRNAVLVVPQGPFDAPDSFGGKLEDPGGFARFIKEVSERLQQSPTVKFKSFTVGNIILSGHSGGYQVISSILDRGSLAGQIKEVWLFDALYARTDKFLAWSEKSGGRLIDIYTEHGGTKSETEQMMGLLKERRIPFLTTKETEITAADLRRNRLVFMHSELAHDDVVNEHQSFEQFLATSILGELPTSPGQSPSPKALAPRPIGKKDPVAERRLNDSLWGQTGKGFSGVASATRAFVRSTPWASAKPRPTATITPPLRGAKGSRRKWRRKAASFRAVRGN